MFDNEIKALLKKELKKEVELEVPPNAEMGDFAFPCFSLAKEFKKNPVQIAQELANKIKKTSFIERIEAKGPYLNFFLNKKNLAEQVLSEVLKEKDKYGSENTGKLKTVAIEYSSPNIAKPFHIGHLRSTIIGQTLYLIHKFLGFKVIRLNYLGDWGTQFGKIIVAYLKYGNKNELKKDPIKHLSSIYTKINKEIEKKPELEEEARAWFKKLEENNGEAVKLWAKFKHLSLDEFRKIYGLLRVEFDAYDGESFHKDKDKPVLDLLEKKKIAVLDQGAFVVKLDESNMPALMLRKSDGTTTYASRDLGAAYYRLITYKPEKIIYVVGTPQTLHFRQLFSVLDKAKLNEGKFVHVPFGQYLQDGKLMGTRKGNAVFMEEVLNKANELALKTIEEKNPKLKNKKDVAKKIGIGAVIFGDLMNDAIKDIEFDWEKILDFEGDTGPYIQYTYARAKSIIRKAGRLNLKKIKYEMLDNDAEKKLVTLVSQFKEKVQHACRDYKPHIIAQYLIELARAFNEFYHACHVLKEENKDAQKARLALILSVSQVIKNGLGLMNIEVNEEM